MNESDSIAKKKAGLKLGKVLDRRNSCNADFFNDDAEQD